MEAPHLSSAKSIRFKIWITLLASSGGISLMLLTGCSTQESRPDAAESPQYDDYEQTAWRHGLPETAAEGDPNQPHAMPQLPVWPPPEPSTRAVLSRDYFAARPGQSHLLGDVDKVLSDALTACGYLEKSYYGAPNGFAIVTRLERIEPNGAPMPGDLRFGPEPMEFPDSLREFIRVLFVPKPGYYRIIVFVVTSEAFDSSRTDLPEGDAIKWLNGGSNRLPSSVASEPWTPEHDCTALIYEYEQQDRGRPVERNVKSRLTCKDHLTKAGLWSVLETRP